MPGGFSNRFTGGAKLDAILRDLARKVERPGTLSVGFLEGATYPDGTSVPMVAALQEYGAPAAGIPPRPYFRGMIASRSGTWGATLAALLKGNGYDGHAALNLMGEEIAADLRDSIIAVTAPPLSPVTLMLRQMRAKSPGLRVTGKVVGEAAARVAAGQTASGVSTKPLIQTGQMLNSVEYRVDE